jgi:hypothetical protein
MALSASPKGWRRKLIRQLNSDESQVVSLTLFDQPAGNIGTAVALGRYGAWTPSPTPHSGTAPSGSQLGLLPWYTPRRPARSNRQVCLRLGDASTRYATKALPTPWRCRPLESPSNYIDSLELSTAHRSSNTRRSHRVSRPRWSRWRAERSPVRTCHTAAGHHAKVADVANLHVGSPRHRYSRPRRHSDVCRSG